MGIIQLTPERLPHAAGILARAFLDDPMMRWGLGGDLDDREDLLARTTAYFRAVNEDGVREGWLWESSDATGAAVWLPPEATAAFAADDLTTRPAVAALTDDGGIRYGRFWDWLDEHLPTRAAWYLDQIGVDPAAQGHGIGSALIRHGLEMARASGVGAFLETGNPRNVGLYERHGFRVAEDADAPDGGPHIWFMSWEP